MADGRMRRRLFISCALFLLLFSGCMSDAVLSRRLAESESGRGMLLEEDGRYAEAFDAFRAALELEPGSLRYQYESSRLAFLAGDIRYGSRQAEDLHRRYPENVLVSELFAYGCMLEGRDDESERLYRELLEKHERYGPAALNLSLLLERRGAYREAFDILRPSADEWKDETVAGFGKRKLYLRLADLASGAFMPGDELIWLTKALKTKGEPEGGAGAASSGTRPSEEAEKQDDELALKLRLATLLADQGRPEEAVTYYQELSDAGTLTAEATFDFARILLVDLERYQEGLEELRLALDAGFTDDAAIEKLLSEPDLLDPDAIRQVLDASKKGASP
ncbi:tetratricopeptide repeat protein [Sediminispirochaeta bajacaliforniensis]|uniref:tetratricopeptide repeat protein n=1 Tax=Sediminispirochaeta bajacaliforniensis TaxID=148 RepID=UPI001FE212CF|nr:tetratricopeptide repeat protein [Sediminispirochaeta bajacaliforniensis]